MKIKVLFLHGVTAIGGAERELVAIVRELDHDRFDPVVVCSDHGPLFQELKSIGVRTVILPLPAWRKVRYFPFLLSATYRLYRFLNKENIQLLHVNDIWWVPQAYWASCFLGIPWIAHVRQEIEPKKASKYRLKKADLIVAMSSQIKDQLEQGGIESSKIRILYSGVDAAKQVPNSEKEKVLNQCNIRSDQPVIGTVANLYPRKGYEYLLAALVQVCEAFPDVVCLIIGEGDQQYKEKLKKLVAQENLGKNVLFLGHQPNVRPYLSAMNLMVLPSIMEGLGIVLLEAMAMGKAIIATRVGGIPDVVVDGVTGVLVEPQNSKALGKEIIRLLKNPEKSAQLGKAGYHRVCNQFSIEQMITQLLKYYDEILPCAKNG